MKIGSLVPDSTDDISGLCILSQNSINDKIYLVLWFWIVIVLVAGILQILLELAFFCIPALRNLCIKWKVGSLLTEQMKIYLHNDNLRIADWFFLCQIGKNSDKKYFAGLLENLAEEKFGCESIPECESAPEQEKS